MGSCSELDGVWQYVGLYLHVILIMDVSINPLTARIFTFFGHLFIIQSIRGQSVTQRSIGREAPRYPPQYPGP